VSATVAEELVVLASGGADSSILMVDQAMQGRVVWPIYIHFGLAWEDVEEAHLRRFLDAVSGQSLIRPLTVFELPIADVYGSHWSVSGADVPDEATPDDAVYLPGRNVLLLAKTTVWCALHGVGTIALGTLRGNPFSDSSPAFFSGFAVLAGAALDHPLEVITPFAGMSKAEVLERGRDLPLEHTFSCVAPVGNTHCQTCNKCGERRKAFAAVGIEDPTAYALG
jgi:7-cyano-7-deazaguanine synthase